ncbi:MAG: S8/S53 family peptidase [Pseudomonadota bacterium]
MAQSMTGDSLAAVFDTAFGTAGSAPAPSAPLPAIPVVEEAEADLDVFLFHDEGGSGAIFDGADLAAAGTEPVPAAQTAAPPATTSAGVPEAPTDLDIGGFTLSTPASAEAGQPGAEAAAPSAGRLSFWSWYYESVIQQRTEAEPAPPVAEPTAFTADDFMGAGQTIVVIDDGLSPFYDQSSTVFSYDFAGFNDPDASVDTVNSHGSWVAQTALGVAGEADIIHLKVFPDSGAGASLNDIDQALDWVIQNGEEYNVTAVNLSLGFGNTTDPAVTGLSEELAILDDMGIYTVVAAGNDGDVYEEGVNILAADPNAIAVSATDSGNEFASFSQRDAELTDIAAIGVGVPVETVGGATGSVNGTSFAAPYVSGTAARLQEASETINGERLTDEEFLEILRNSGTDVVGAPDADGYVVADADAAVEYFIANAEDYRDDPFIA